MLVSPVPTQVVCLTPSLAISFCRSCTFAAGAAATGFASSRMSVAGARGFGTTCGGCRGPGAIVSPRRSAPCPGQIRFYITHSHGQCTFFQNFIFFIHQTSFFAHFYFPSPS